MAVGQVMAGKNAITKHLKIFQGTIFFHDMILTF